MGGIMKIFRMTVVGGVLFLTPLIILTIVVGKALLIVGKLTGPISGSLPVQSLVGVEMSKIFAVLVLLFICFVAGLFARTGLAKKLVTWLESAFLSNLPGYSFMKHMGEEFAGADASHAYETVQVRFDDLWQLGFLVEKLEDGRVVVYFPGAPSPWSGGVVVVEAERVLPLSVPSTSAVRTFQKLGEGTGALLGKVR